MAKHEEPDPAQEKPRFKEFLDLGETAGARREDIRPPNPDPWPAHEVTPGPPDPWPAHEVTPGPPDPWPPHEASPSGPEPFEDLAAEPEPLQEGAGAPQPPGPEPARAHAPQPLEDAHVDPRAFQRLLKVTGAVVLLLIVLAVTDALILYAFPLAFIAVVAALFYCAGFIAPTFAFQRYVRAAFVLMLGVFCVTAFLGWREKQTARGLARVIVPVPRIGDVAYTPAGEELAAAIALSLTFEAIDGALSRQAVGQAPDTAERARRARVANASSQRYWVVETELGIAQVMEFYARPENRVGWAVVAERPEGLLSLRRGDEELLIMASDGSGRARSKVGYLYLGGGEER